MLLVDQAEAKGETKRKRQLAAPRQTSPLSAMLFSSKLSRPVVVTGANGFVGLHVVRVLLQQGHTVHATVRDVKDERKTQPLQALASKHSTGKLRLFTGNLLEAGSFHSAMEECQVVYHTASPFLISNVTNPFEQVLEPALQGTQHVLEGVNETTSVERVVLTSSVAAVRASDQFVPLNKVAFTEKDWNTSTVDSTSNARNVYSYSKAAAERLAWDMCAQQERWNLAVINPALVLGPTLSPNVTSESFAILKACLQGTAKNGALNVVDVRDVALAHYRAGTFPDAQGRHLLCSNVVEIKTICESIREAFPGKYPHCEITDDNAVEMFKIDNTRSCEKLGIEYHALSDTIADTVTSYEQAIGSGPSR